MLSFAMISGSAVIILRPIYLVKHWKDERAAKDNTINPDTTEAVMKNIRGIPFLIQVSSTEGQPVSQLAM
ncbi:unnamed protein product [Haemonchus placei]|uniref:Uncharacterized protein n=1 Tax=Haemonchus placei TaxID=6290 RepID=A0A3P7V1W1_HAEPC|nr:unnamed protein product [Haemonchus placei]